MTATEKYLSDVISISPDTYKGLYKWLLENGKHYKVTAAVNDDYEYMIKNTPARQCFKTSLLAALTYPELDYIEGYYCTESLGFPFNHGFNTNSENEVIDFTAIAGGLKVSEYFGVKLDLKHAHKFLESKYNGVTSYLSWYYQNIINP